MLLNKEVEVTVVANNVKKYLDLGYIIPQRPSIEDPNKLVYDFPAKILIKIEDLGRYSTAKVDVLCDYCKENICHPSYANYNKVMNNTGGTYACLDCTNKKRQENNKMKYGVAFPVQLPEIRNKIEQTNVQKTGYICALADPEKREIGRMSMLNKYGVESPIQSPEIRERMYATNFERYGVHHPLQNNEIRQRAEQTNLERFGNIHASSTKVVKDKIQKTCQEKWGANSYFATNEFREKSAKSFYKHGTQSVSKQQKYICDLYGGLLNYPCDRYNLDIVLDSLAIEIDFGGHDLQVKLGNMTEDEFKRREIIRNNIVKRAGYKTIRIISRHDYLPSDSTLLNMLQYAREYFTSNPKRSWISFDIDNKVIYNAYHKESELGLPYDYGKLRKIKNLDKKL